MPVLIFLATDTPPLVRAGGCFGALNGDFLKAALPMNLSLRLIPVGTGGLSTTEGEEPTARFFRASSTDPIGADLLTPTPDPQGGFLVSVRIGDRDFERPGHLHKLVISAHGDEINFLPRRKRVLFLSGENTFTLFYLAPGSFSSSSSSSSSNSLPIGPLPPRRVAEGDRSSAGL